MVRLRSILDSDIFIGSFSNVDTLKSIDVSNSTNYPQFTKAYVETTGEYYLDRFSILPENIPTILSATGGGRWISIGGLNQNNILISVANAVQTDNGGVIPGTLIVGSGIDSTAGGILYIGNSSNYINIGNSNSQIQFNGTILYENILNTEIKDRLITLNKNGSINSGGNSGFEIEEDDGSGTNGIITGYFKTDSNRNGYDLKVPGNNFKTSLDFSLVGSNNTYYLPSTTGTLALLSNLVLSGDVVGSGTSGIVTTLATVNTNVGTFGSDYIIPVLTVNGKGLITSVVNTSIPISSSSTSGLLDSSDWSTFNSKQNSLIFGDLYGSDFNITGGTNAVIGSGISLALNLQNGLTPGTYNNITVNSKGIVTTAFTITSIFNEIPSGVVNGINLIFNTINSFIGNTTQLYLNGLRMSINIDYIESDVNQITFMSAPFPGENIIIDYKK